MPKSSAVSDTAKPRSPLSVATLLLATTGVVVSPLLQTAALAQATTGSTTRPLSIPIANPEKIDWNARIKESLLKTGSVDSLAIELRRITSNDPVVLDARIRVAFEQGNLAEALDFLTQRAAATPSDVAVLRKLAYVQELTGAADPAEITLRAALAAESNPAAQVDIRLRLSVLLFDDHRPDEATMILEEIVKLDPKLALRAGVISYLAGEYKAAARYLAAGKADKVPLRLLAGNAALKAGQFAQASEAFASVYEVAKQPADRRYAQERLIASARSTGSLAKLAQSWLNDPNLPSDRLFPLATTLRELGQVKELLAWWRTATTRPEYEAQVLSTRFINEILGAAQSGGLAGEAEAIAKDVLAKKPESQQWLAVNLRILLGQGKLAEADQLLIKQVEAGGENPHKLDQIASLAMSFGRDGPATAAAKKLRALGGGNAITGLLIQAGIVRRAGDTTQSDALLREAAALAVNHSSTAISVASALEAAGMIKDASDLLKACADKDAAAGNPLNDLVLDQLAAMLMEQNRPAEALPIFKQLMRSAPTVAGRSQASKRYLEAATAADLLGPLVAQIKSRLEAGKADEHDLTILVDTYIQQKRFDEAAKTLRETTLIPKLSKLNRLAILFLRTNNYDEASETLNELVKEEPENAVNTLEQLASVELNRRDTDAATDAIDEIRARIGTDPRSNDLMAGVYDRLNKPLDAARIYRRALAANPENAEEWLLWATASAKAGKAAEARQRLQVLCGEASSDNVFALACDGLLNANASSVALRAARRDAILRASNEPTRMILFHLISDISDELQDSSQVLRATDANIALNYEERPQRLREQMEFSSNKGMIDVAVECGRSMLALGDEFPPQLFIGLGEQLLVAGRFDEANSAFARSQESAPDVLVATKIAELLETYGSPSLALDTLAPIADRKRNDATFRESVGRLNEVMGNSDKAFEEYFASLQSVINEVVVDKSVSTPPNAQAGYPAGYIVPTSSYNRSTLAPQVDRLIDNILAALRTPEQKETLIRFLDEKAKKILADAPAGPHPTNAILTISSALRTVCFISGLPDAADRFDDEIIAHWPESAAIRQVALNSRKELGLLTRSTEFAAKYKITDSLLRRSASTLVSGTPTTAPSAISAHWAASVLPALIARGELELAKDFLSRVPIEAAQLESLPNDSQYGYGDKASLLSQSSVPATLIAACKIVGDDERANKWALTWFTAVRTLAANAPANPRSGLVGRGVAGAVAANPTSRPARSGANAAAGAASRPTTPPVMAAASVAGVITLRGGGMVPNQGSQQIRLVVSNVWRILSHEGRAQLVKALVDDKSSSDPAGQALYLLQIAASEPGLIENPGEIANRIFSANSQGSGNAVTLAQVYGLLPAADRIKFLKQALDAVPANGKLSFIFRVLNSTPSTLDDASNEAILESLKSLPEKQIVEWSEWFNKTSHRKLLIPLADALLAKGQLGADQRGAIVFGAAGAAPATAARDDGTALGTAAAVAYAVSGENPGRADELALSALNKLRLTKAPVVDGPPNSLARLQMNSGGGPNREALTSLAAAVLSPEARKAFLVTLDTAPKLPTTRGAAQALDLPWQRLFKAAVETAIGERDKALDTYRSAYARDPSQQDSRMAYAERLVADGRYAEYVDAMGSRLISGNEDPTNRDPAARAAIEAYQNLFRVRETRRATEGGSMRRFGGSIVADFMTPMVSNDVDKLLETLRGTLARLRESRFASIVVIEPEAGGLAPRAERGERGRSSVPLTITSAMPTWPGAGEEIRRFLHSMQAPNSYYASNYNWMTEVITQLSKDAAARDALLKTLDDTAKARLLTTGDRLIIAALGRQADVKLSAPLLNELWTSAVASDEMSEYSRLSEVLQAQKDPRAESLTKWVSVRESFGDVAIQMSRAGNLNRPKRSGPPGPFDNVDESSVAWIKSMFATDPKAAEAALADLRQNNRVSSNHTTYSLLWTRFAAERGDMAAFRSRLEEIVSVSYWRAAASTPYYVYGNNGPDRNGIDVAEALPAKPADAAAVASVVREAASVLTAAAERWPDKTDITITMVNLGVYAREKGNAEVAREMLDKAAALADRQGLGQHQLYIADLAAQLGLEDRSVAVQRKLLEARCLPAVRILPLLIKIAATDPVAAKQLGADAARYCLEPRLQQWVGQTMN